MAQIYDVSAKNIKGETVSLGDYKGKVLLIVNVASECGLTPHYTGLEEAYEKYAEQGFAVLGFPCNQFGAQEPGDEAAINTFCQTQFGVKFPMFAKVDVNGDNTHDLYKVLKAAKKDDEGKDDILWNFEKFLVGKDGEVLKRYHPKTLPADIHADIEAALN